MELASQSQRRLQVVRAVKDRVVGAVRGVIDRYLVQPVRGLGDVAGGVRQAVRALARAAWAAARLAAAGALAVEWTPLAEGCARAARRRTTSMRC